MLTEFGKECNRTCGTLRKHKGARLRALICSWEQTQHPRKRFIGQCLELPPFNKTHWAQTSKNIRAARNAAEAARARMDGEADVSGFPRRALQERTPT